MATWVDTLKRLFLHVSYDKYVTVDGSNLVSAESYKKTKKTEHSTERSKSYMSFIDDLVNMATSLFLKNRTDDVNPNQEDSTTLTEGMEIVDTSKTLQNYVRKLEQAQRVFTPETFRLWLSEMQITQQTVADAIGVSQSSVSRFLRGCTVKAHVAEACRTYANNIIDNSLTEFVYADYMKITAPRCDHTRFKFFEVCDTERILQVLSRNESCSVNDITTHLPNGSKILGGLVCVIDEDKVDKVVGITVSDRFIAQGDYPTIIECAEHDLTCAVVYTYLMTPVQDSTQLVPTPHVASGIIIVFLDPGHRDLFLDIATTLCKGFIDGTQPLTAVNVFFTKPKNKHEVSN